jgi:hypothetical protein
MNTHEAAVEKLAQLNDYQLMNNKIRVDWAKRTKYADCILLTFINTN